MDVFLVREWLVMMPLILHHFAMGLLVGYHAILTPAISGNSSDIAVTKDEASWIAATFGMTGSIGYLFLPALMQIYGRKLVHTLLNMIVFSGSAIIALAPNVTTLIAGRAVQGLAFSGLTIAGIIASEYVHPKRRGFFVAFKITATSVGILICHSVAFSLSWRTVAWIGSFPGALAVVGTIFWPESPHWLAYKGRYSESVSAFEWLRGKDTQAKEEMKELISAQYKLRKLKIHQKNSLLRLKHAFRSKEFLKPFIIVNSLLIASQVGGQDYLMAYVIQIMDRFTGDKNKAYYYTIGLDIIKIVAVLLTSYLVRLFSRRSLLFCAGFLSYFILGLLCIIQYLEYKGLFILNWLSPILLILYTVLLQSGVIPLSIVIKGEIFPLKYKGIALCTTGIIYSLSNMLIMKITLDMFDTLQIHGTLAVYGGIGLVIIIFLYFILPETKDRTLQNIENEFINIKVNMDPDIMTKLVK